MAYTNLGNRIWIVQAPLVGSPPVAVGDAMSFQSTPQTVKRGSNSWGTVGSYSGTSTTHTITGTVSTGGYFQITVTGSTMSGAVATTPFFDDGPLDPPTGSWTAEEGGWDGGSGKPKPPKPGKKPKKR